MSIHDTAMLSCYADGIDQSRYFFFEVAPQLYSRG
jgi:hypothetical protein